MESTKNLSSLRKKDIDQKITKHMYTRFASENYSLPLMMAELIDNSIASYEKKYVNPFTNKLDFENLSYDKLDIIFKFNFTSKMKTYAYIFDNASGMTFEELEHSAKMYETKNFENVQKSDSDLNQHGIGLKACAFWLGEDATIMSKREEDNVISQWTLKTRGLTDEEECKPIAEEVMFDDFHPLVNFKEFRNNVFENKKYHGTTIRIENINKANDKINYFEKENIGFMQLFLGFKYKRYIKKGLKIKVQYLNDEDKKSEKVIFDILAAEIKPFNLNDFYNLIEEDKKISKIEQSLRTEYKNTLEKKAKLDNSFDSSFFDKLSYLLLEKKDVLIKKGLEIETKRFASKTPITIGVISTNKININLYNSDNELVSSDDFIRYGYDKKSITKWCKFKYLQGLNCYHHNRGIYIGPWLDNSNKIEGRLPTPISFAPNNKSINSKPTPIRMFAEIDVVGKTEVNKSEIYDIKKDLIQRQLGNIWEKYFSGYLDIIASVKDKNTINESQANKVNQSISEKISFDNFNCNIVIDEETKEVAEWQYSFDFALDGYDHNSFEFTIKEKNYIEKNTLFDYRFLKNQALKNVLKYEIYFSLNHPFWAPFNDEEKLKDKKKFREFAIPLIISFFLTEFYTSLSIQSGTGNIFNEVKISKILNHVIKNWKDKNNKE